MNRSFATLVAFLALSNVALAQVPMTGAGKGTPAPPAGYQGPGDKVAGATMWYGLRAYSAAKRGNPAISICEPTGATCVDWVTDAVTGNLVHGTNPGGTDCTAVNTCTIATIYDQTQGNACNSASCDEGQSTNGLRFTLTWNCQNGHPCLVGNGVFYVSGLNVFTATLPVSVTAVANRNPSATTQQGITLISGLYLVFTTSANQVGIYNGSFVTASASDTNPHSFVGIYTSAGTSCVLDVDAIGGTPGSCNNTSGPVAVPVFVGTDNISGQLIGKFYEAGGWNNKSFTGGAGGEQDLLISNERTYWGF